MKVNFKSGAILALLLIVAAWALFSGRSNPPQNDIVRVAYLPIAECAPLFLKEHFAKEGITLELSRETGGSHVIEKLVAGTTDVGFSNVISAIFAVSSGFAIQSVAGATIEDKDHSLHGLVIRKASSTPFDAKTLKGKTVAINTRNNIDHLMLREWLASSGVAEADIKLIEVPFPEMKPRLQSGNIDAAAMVEPFLTQAKQDGMSSVANYYFSSTSDSITIASFFTTKTWATTETDTCRRFRKALRNAISDLRNDPKKFRETIKLMTNLKDDVINHVALPDFRSELTEDMLVRHYERMLKHGFIKDDGVDLKVLRSQADK